MPIVTSPFGLLIVRTIRSQSAMFPARAPEVELLQDDLVEPLLGQHDRHLVDRLHVLGGDDRFLRHVAEEGELGLDVGERKRSCGRGGCSARSRSPGARARCAASASS